MSCVTESKQLKIRISTRDNSLSCASDYINNLNKYGLKANSHWPSPIQNLKPEK